MNVAVLGAGGGGLAVAYEWASQGHRVSLYARRAHEHHLAPVRERGGIRPPKPRIDWQALRALASLRSAPVDTERQENASLTCRQPRTVPTAFIGLIGMGTIVLLSKKAEPSPETGVPSSSADHSI